MSRRQGCRLPQKRETLAARAVERRGFEISLPLSPQRLMTSPNRPSSAASGTAATAPTARKSLTLMQMLALIAFGGLAASLVLKQFV
jgi:hypothetical protein